MEELREYDAVVGGTETVLLLTPDDAKARGLTGKGRARKDGEHMVDDVNADTEDAQKIREEAAKVAEEKAQKELQEANEAAQKAAKARTARNKAGTAQGDKVDSPQGDK